MKKITFNITGFQFIFSLLLVISSSAVFSQQPITALPTAGYIDVNDASNNYSIPGNGSNANYPAGTIFDLEFSSTTTTDNDFVLGTNLVAGGVTWNITGLVTDFFVRRNGAVNGNTNRQILWFETESATGNTRVLRPSYTPSVEESFRGFKLNIGSDNTFVNQGSAQSNNIERFDYVNARGFRTATPANAGFPIFERNGNDPFRIAIVTNIDAAGNPTAFGGIVNIAGNAATWGTANLKEVNYLIFQKQDADVDLRPAENGGPQQVRGTVITLADLGVNPNQIVYGYVLLPNDATSTDWTLNPQNTGNADGGMDAFPGGGIVDNDGGVQFVASEILANDDDFTGTPVNGVFDRRTDSVFLNDTLDGNPFANNEVTATIEDNGGLTGASINPNGTITVPAGTPSGIYMITYRICEAATPTNCESATATIAVITDSDGDGVIDADDICPGFNDFVDNDGDTVPDGCDDDDDNDGILDVDECTDLPQTPIAISIGADNVTTDTSSPLPGDVGDFATYTNAAVYQGQSVDLTLTVVRNSDPDDIDVNIQGVLSAAGDYFPIVLFPIGGVDLADGAVEFRMDFTRTSDGTPIEVPVKLTFIDIDNDNEGVEFNTSAVGTYTLSGAPTSNINVLQTTTTFFGEVGDVVRFSNTIPDDGTDAQENWARIDLLEATNVLFTVRKRTGTPGYSFNDAVFSDPGPTVSIAGVPCDSDGDGFSDYLDTDSDNDGCPDAVEGDGPFTNSDLTSSNNLADDDEGSVDGPNGVPTNTGSPQATNSAVITAGPDADGDGIADACDTFMDMDTDSDGVFDQVDIDDDNDGILDTVESGGIDPSADDD